ncbi:hypothetical protein LINPERHAP2_LOCUS37860 [Linum perenne]
MSISMSRVLLCLVIVVSVSLHACNARHLMLNRRVHVDDEAEYPSLEAAPEGSMKIRRGREVMMVGQEANVKETKDIGTSTEEEEDGTSTSTNVGVMDYAQPHRRPPIHNEKL